LNYPEGFTITTLRPSRKGMNKRGLCSHKPTVSRTKKPKRQGTMGFAPQPLTAYRTRLDRI